MSICPSCGARTLTAVIGNGTISVDPVPHTDGAFTLRKMRGYGAVMYAWRVKGPARPGDDARYRKHACEAAA